MARCILVFLFICWAASGQTLKEKEKDSKAKTESIDNGFRSDNFTSKNYSWGYETYISSLSTNAHRCEGSSQQTLMGIPIVYNNMKSSSFLLLDSQSPYMIILSDQGQECKIIDCKLPKEYTPVDFNYSYLNNKTIDTSLKEFNCSNMIKFNNSKVSQQLSDSFYVDTSNNLNFSSLGLDPSSQICGSLGLAMNFEKNSSLQTYLFQNQFNQTIMLNINMDKPGDDSCKFESSRVFIGGIVQNYFLGKNISTFQLENVSPDNIVNPYLPIKEVLLKTDQGNQTLDSENRLYLHLEDKGLLFNSNLNFPFNNKSTLVFKLGPVLVKNSSKLISDSEENFITIEISWQDLFVGNKSFIGPSSLAVGGEKIKNNWVMGAIPLSKYVVMIDYENKRVSIADKAEETLIKEIFAILAIFVVISMFTLVFPLLIFFLHKKKDESYAPIRQSDESDSRSKDFMTHDSTLNSDKSQNQFNKSPI